VEEVSEVDTTTLAHDADRRRRLVNELLALVDHAERQGRRWTPTPAFDRAVTRWSRQAESPLDVLVLVAEVRASRRTTTQSRTRVLEHLQLVAVAAVSERLVQDALTDALTGLSTRARLDDEVQHLLATSLRNRTPLTAVVLDVDGLKQINDTQGHAAGDAALAEVGRAIRTHLRKVDRAFRVGGDEFVLFLPSTEAADARSVVERIQHHCATSFSVGVATHSGEHWDDDVAAWMQRADAEMYEQRQQLRAMVPTVVTQRRSGGARLAGMVVAAGVSVGAWAGIATAVHQTVSGRQPTQQAVTNAGQQQVTRPATTVALPRTVGPAVLTPSSVRPVVQAPVARPAVVRPAAPSTPVVQVPTAPVPAVEVPGVEIPVPEDPSAPQSSSRGLLGSVLDTVSHLLRPIF
jgi:diguanylate cyclase (GGDEF)-like protein